jgi:hypothetical protein
MHRYVPAPIWNAVVAESIIMYQHQSLNVRMVGYYTLVIKKSDFHKYHQLKVKTVNAILFNIVELIHFN